MFTNVHTDTRAHAWVRARTGQASEGQIGAAAAHGRSMAQQSGCRTVGMSALGGNRTLEPRYMLTSRRSCFHSTTVMAPKNTTANVRRHTLKRNQPGSASKLTKACERFRRLITAPVVSPWVTRKAFHAAIAVGAAATVARLTTSQLDV